MVTYMHKQEPLEGLLRTTYTIKLPWYSTVNHVPRGIIALITPKRTLKSPWVVLHNNRNLKMGLEKRPKPLTIVSLSWVQLMKSRRATKRSQTSECKIKIDLWHDLKSPKEVELKLRAASLPRGVVFSPNLVLMGDSRLSRDCPHINYIHALQKGKQELWVSRLCDRYDYLKLCQFSFILM